MVKVPDVITQKFKLRKNYATSRAWELPEFKLRKKYANYAKITQITSQVPKNYVDYAPPTLLMYARHWQVPTGVTVTVAHWQPEAPSRSPTRRRPSRCVCQPQPERECHGKDSDSNARVTCGNSGHEQINTEIEYFLMLLKPWPSTEARSHLACHVLLRYRNQCQQI